jgi:hypothetical protein
MMQRAMEEMQAALQAALSDRRQQGTHLGQNQAVNLIGGGG